MEKIIDEQQQGNSLVLEPKAGNGRKLMIESYGCQMNFSDTEIGARRWNAHAHANTV